MKRRFKKWMLRLTATGGLIIALLLLIVLNPVLTYANKTTHGTYSIFHHQGLQPSTLARLDEATGLLQQSEFYNPSLQIDLCLNDGSVYPKLMRTLRGPAFAWGFYNKVVLQGKADFAANTVELNGYKWNLSQLLAHEVTHCLQYDALGFWKSNPVANISEWKWEGYAEYIARQDANQQDLRQNIARLVEAEQQSPSGWAVAFADGTIAPRNYYGYWVLVHYCMSVKGLTYRQLLADTTEEQTLRIEMMRWYQSKTAQ